MSCETCGREIKNYGVFMHGVRCPHYCGIRLVPDYLTQTKQEQPMSDSGREWGASSDEEIRRRNEAKNLANHYRVMPAWHDIADIENCKPVIAKSPKLAAEAFVSFHFADLDYPTDVEVVVRDYAGTVSTWEVIREDVPSFYATPKPCN